MTFSLQDFIDNPTLEKVDSCRKDDLLCIAAHFDIPVKKYGVKREIKRRVMEKLSELGVLDSSDVSAQLLDDVSAASVPSLGACASPHVDSQGKEVNLATPQGEALVHEAAPATLPRFEPFSPQLSGSSGDVKLKVRLARLQIEAQERQRKADYDLKLEIRRLEIEAEKEVKLRRLEVEAMRVSSGQTAYMFDNSALAQTNLQKQNFDVSKNIALVPTFRESEVDSYFNAFERIATALDWPKDMWPILLQCKLVGKAQEVVSSLPLEDSLQYDVLKEAILRAYELVPEAYRQKFRNHRKSSGQTFVEFAREKGVLFDKWCTANGVANSFEALRQLMLIEDFKDALPDKMVMFLNEQKVTSLSKAAVLADEFVLTHKNVFVSSSRSDRTPVSRPSRLEAGHSTPERAKGPTSSLQENRECFYCHKRGHVIADCLSLKQKQQSPSVPQKKGVCLIKTGQAFFTEQSRHSDKEKPDPCFRPFVSEGFVSLTGDLKDQKTVTILRDTGGSQSIIRAGILPLSALSSCNSSAIVQGVGMSYIPAPLHHVHVQSSLVSGSFKVAVLPELPVKGIDFILGNDLAGGKVHPVPEEVLPLLSLTKQRN